MERVLKEVGAEEQREDEDLKYNGMRPPSDAASGRLWETEHPTGGAAAARAAGDTRGARLWRAPAVVFVAWRWTAQRDEEMPRTWCRRAAPDTGAGRD